MLMNGRDLLAVANEHSFAVPAFNISDWAMCQGIFDISEELDAPLIVAIHPDEVAHIGRELLPAIIERAHRSLGARGDPPGPRRHLRAGAAGHPVRVHVGDDRRLDAAVRGERRDHQARGRRRRTPSACPSRASSAPSASSTSRPRPASPRRTSSTPTPPRRSSTSSAPGVDSLAVAIGTAHGLYPKGLKPELKLDLLQEIKALLPIPLVLHGGSGNPDDEIGQSVKLGHQQDQHLERHQGRLPRRDARGAGRHHAARAAR